MVSKTTNPKETTRRGSIMAANLTSPKERAFLMKNGSGIVSVGMKKEDLDRLNLTVPEMVDDEDSSAPTFTITMQNQEHQLELAMEIIEKEGRGVVVYLRGHEERGIGLGHKLRACNLQDQGHDTVQANLELGLAIDARDYGIGAQMLRDIGVRTMRLMTNNPAKFTGLKGYGLAVVGRVPVVTPITKQNRRYMETKRKKMGHVYISDIDQPLA